MPVEVSERALHDAVAVLAEQRLDGRQAAEAALDWLGWEREGPLHLRRYDVQLFAWYVLPRKFLAPLEDKREAAAAVARMLESIGGRAATYAEVCRGPQTDDLLCAWEAEDPRAWRSFRKLLEDSGIEPPDTDLLTWGQTMGPCEALARERVSIALEEAHEAGRLRPGAAGSRRGQKLVAIAALSEPWEEGGAVTCLQAVQAERLERWRDPRLTRKLGAQRDARVRRCARGHRAGRDRTGGHGGRRCPCAVAPRAGRGRDRPDADRRIEPGARSGVRHVLAGVVGRSVRTTAAGLAVGGRPRLPARGGLDGVRRAARR